MPAKSRSQFRFMEAVKHGDIKKPGLSKEEASEFTDGMTKGHFKKLKEKIGKK